MTQDVAIESAKESSTEPKGYERFATISVDEFLPLIGTAETGEVLGKTVGLSSKRLLTIAKETCCGECKVTATFAAIERNNHRKTKAGNSINRPDTGWHVNIYGVKNGEPVMLTRDHIIPLSLNGPDTLENSQTLCKQCNGKKASKVYLPNFQLLVESEMLRVYSKARPYEKLQVKAAIIAIQKFFQENTIHIKHPPVVNIGTAVSLAMNDKTEDLVAFLAERPDLIHEKTHNGQNLLHFAAAKGNIEALDHLESLGVQWIEDKGGLNPWQFAVVNRISSRFVKLSGMLDWCVEQKHMGEEDKALVMEVFDTSVQSRRTKTQATNFCHEAQKTVLTRAQRSLSMQ